ncbi:hypothetical protein [Sulfurimonas sp. CVO]|uniref:hypothetical protein n=1 Tax=Sulfurimonas sp. CVO TaxID=2283483 RepID=UPI00135A4A0F|nr:hypothetical protein [Sulfurimonas sp. CVO]
MKKIAVIGVGNILFCDDEAGIIYEILFKVLIEFSEVVQNRLLKKRPLILML